MGALDAQRVGVVHQHQGWRLISFRIGFLYLTSGFGGSLLSALFIQYGIYVGASGALFGLLGSMLSELISNWTMYVNKVNKVSVYSMMHLFILAAWLTLLFIIIINLAVGILPHVDNFAQIGGFVSRFLLGFLFLIRPCLNGLPIGMLPLDVLMACSPSSHLGSPSQDVVGVGPGCDTGFGGSLLSALFIQYGISVGACGALFVCARPFDLTVSDFDMLLATLLTLLFIIIINLAVGILPYMDNFAHIGGFVSGFLLGFLFLIRPQFKWLTQRNVPPGRVSTPVNSKHKTYQYVLWVLSLILLIVG
ncbi:unnamed protein product [Malus baccata var. baccata]